MLVRNTAPVSIFNPTSSVCVTSIQYVICASCTVRQVIHATQSTSWYDLTQYETNHSHLNAALSEFVLLKLPRLLILQQVPTWPQEEKLFISLGPIVGWIWMPGWESSKLNGFFFWPERGAVLWAELLFSTSAHKFGVATRKYARFNKGRKSTAEAVSIVLSANKRVFECMCGLVCVCRPVCVRMCSWDGGCVCPGGWLPKNERWRSSLFLISFYTPLFMLTIKHHKYAWG